jgi:hypothetical protein
VKSVESLLAEHLTLYNGKKVFLIDGIKVAKEGRRMPGVKSLFQQSQNNSKPTYIFGHSCQAMHILASLEGYHLAVPLIMRIHEGLGNRRRSLVMRILDFIIALDIRNSYIVGDAYYWAGNLSGALRRRGNHLISRVKSTAVAYTFPSNKKGVGRPKKYGQKKKLKNFFKGRGFTSVIVNLYGRNVNIEYKEKILICNNHQCPIKYVFTKYGKNKCIFASTDVELSALEIIELYAHRFKIEFSFKEFVHDFGGFCYRFWSRSVEKSRKKKIVKRDSLTEHAYQLHLQLAVIAQGMGNILAVKFSKEVWRVHSSWMRTIRPGVIPSAAVVRMALREDFSNFMGIYKFRGTLTKFIKKRRIIDKVEERKAAG